jgi:RimJ/RimL family protein N-acetyltransferase
MFTTDHLILRPYRESDINDILNLTNDLAVERGASDYPIIPHGPEHVEWIRDFQKKSLIYVIVTLKTTGEFMGYSCVWQPGASKNRGGMFGIAILPQYWNKGYGTEVTKFMADHAFRWLGLHRICLTVFESNPRAIAVYKKMYVVHDLSWAPRIIIHDLALASGFVMEGTQRKANWVDGKWEDIYTMGVLETEWTERYWGTKAGSDE